MCSNVCVSALEDFFIISSTSIERTPVFGLEDFLLNRAGRSLRGICFVSRLKSPPVPLFFARYVA